MQQIFGLHYRTHNFIVFGLTENIELKLHRKLAKYIFNLLYNDNIYVSEVMTYLIKCGSSIVGENYRLLSYLYDISPADCENGISRVLRKIVSKQVLSEEQIISIKVVKELIEMRDDLNYNFASKRLINLLLVDICRA